MTRQSKWLAVAAVVCAASTDLVASTPHENSGLHCVTTSAPASTDYDLAGFAYVFSLGTHVGACGLEWNGFFDGHDIAGAFSTVNVVDNNPSTSTSGNLACTPVVEDASRTVTVGVTFYACSTAGGCTVAPVGYASSAGTTLRLQFANTTNILAAWIACTLPYYPTGGAASRIISYTVDF